MSESEEDVGGEMPLKEETLVSYTLLVLFLLLGAAIFFAFLLQRFRVKYIHESLLALGAGALVGVLLRFVPHSLELAEHISFNAETFFFLLLPPIIFSSGYTLQQNTFFLHIGSVMAFAFVGTTIATFVTGLIVYGVVLALGTGISLPVCLRFGALISATDPVTVLAIFHALQVDPQLFALVFGESVLNDAVAIVLYETLGIFVDNPVTTSSVLLAVLHFVIIFVGSFGIGVAVALISALVFKHVPLHDYPMLEASIFVILAYTSYVLAQGVGTSGIVSLLFCGIAMAHYTARNLSVETRELTRSMFSLLAFLAENFTFIYIGVTISTRDDYLYVPALIAGAFFALLISRAVYVFPLAGIVNLIVGDGVQRISLSKQTMLWWSGLRGAIAFALAVQLDNPIMLTTTLAMVILTVALFGSSTPWMLDRLRIPINVRHDRHDEDGEEGDGHGGSKPAGWFGRVDQRYLTPFFVRAQPLQPQVPFSEAPATLMGGTASAEDDYIPMETMERRDNGVAEQRSRQNSEDGGDSSGSGGRGDAAASAPFLHSV